MRKSIPDKRQIKEKIRCVDRIDRSTDRYGNENLQPFFRPRVLKYCNFCIDVSCVCDFDFFFDFLFRFNIDISIYILLNIYLFLYITSRAACREQHCV